MRNQDDICHRTLLPMIQSFRDRRLKRLFERGDRSEVPPDMADKIENVLPVLDSAIRLNVHATSFSSLAQA